MSKQINLKSIIKQKSKSVQNIEEKNQFLQFFHRFDTIETETNNHRQQMYSNPFQIINTSLPSLKAKSRIKNHANNKDIRKILKQMRKHQQNLKDKLQYIERVQIQQRQLQKKSQQFELAQRRIKKRIQITDKKIKTLEKTQSHKKINLKYHRQSNSIICSTTPNINNKQFVIQDSPIKNTTNIISKPQIETVISSTRKENREIVYINLKKNRKKLKYFQNLPIQRKRASKIQNFKYNPEDIPGKKKINYLKYFSSPIKETLQSQLQSQYDKCTRESCKRAAELVDKLSIQRKLKLKDSNEEDYIQANNKIKLLNYFYTLNE